MGKDENIANKLRELRKQMGLSQVKMAQLLGVKTRTYRAYEQAQNDISLDTLIKIADIANVSLDFFRDSESGYAKKKPSTTIPIYGSVPGGHWTEPVEIDDQITIPARISIPIYAFGLWVRGNSMEPTYSDGSLVFVDPEANYDNGDPCVVRLNGEVTLKRYYRQEDKVILQPDNKEYPPIIIEGKDTLEFIGKVIGQLIK